MNATIRRCRLTGERPSAREGAGTRREFLEASSIAASGLLAIAGGAAAMTTTTVTAGPGPQTSTVDITLRVNGHTGSVDEIIAGGTGMNFRQRPERMNARSAG